MTYDETVDELIRASINAIQKQQSDWSNYNFPLRPGHSRDVDDPLLGMMEEMGELSHAILKKKQGIRGTPEQHEAAAKDAVADLFVFMLDLATRRGWTLGDVIVDTWADVRTRDWIKFPKNGRTE
jgi:NTP pyrophosphatase (non-canonical NTP hydrolase)